MRHLLVTASVVCVLAMLGCAHHPAGPHGQTVGTILSTNDNVVVLNAVANDPKKSQDERARAIFTLFAHHIQPGASATDLRHVLTNPSWVQQTHLYAGEDLTGWVPVEITADDTVFAVHLFPEGNEPRWSPWSLYLRLTGRFLQYEDAVAFLKGERGAWNPKLVEFALCFPNSSEPRKFPGRIETFSGTGVRVYEER